MGDFETQLSVLATDDFPFQNGQLVLDASDPEAEILREIDAAVLCTTLRFTSDNSVLELQVSGRRLVLVSDCSDPDLRQIEGRIFSVNCKEDVFEIAKLIISFAEAIEPTSEFVLSLSPMHSELSGMSGRLSVAAIREEILRTRSTEKPGSKLDVVMRNLQDHVLASLQFGGTQAKHALGSEELVAGLREFKQNKLEQFIASEQDVTPATSEPDLTVLSDTLGAGICLGLVRWEAEMVLLAFDVAALFDVIAEFGVAETSQA